MRPIRLLLCLFFAFLAAVTVFLMVAMLFPAWQSAYRWHGGSRFFSILEYELLLLPFAAVFGMACYTVIMQKKWARAWATAASIVLLLFFAILLTRHALAEMGCGVIFGVGGLLGLIAFARRSTILDFDELSEN